MRHHVIASFALLALSTTGCHLNGSKTKDAFGDHVAASIGSAGLFGVQVDKKDIQQYIAPATGDNGVPTTMNGIWWTNAVTVHFVVSFKNAVWDEPTRLATILMTGPGTYSTPVGQDEEQDFVTAVPIDKSYGGYDIKFDEDGINGELLTAYTDDHGDRQRTDKNHFTMVYTNDGEWTRHTPNQPDYGSITRF